MEKGIFITTVSNTLGASKSCVICFDYDSVESFEFEDSYEDYPDCVKIHLKSGKTFRVLYSDYKEVLS